jgi:hypothetical protein
MADLTPPVHPPANHEVKKMADNITPPHHDKTNGIGNGSSPIIKPPEFSMEGFKSKRAATIANVETLLNGLPHHRISEAGDFVRLHSNEERYWSPELCFVTVPIKGAKKDSLHLILEDLAMQYLESKVIKRFRLALATKPDDRFFLCHVPSQNLDNKWNETVLDGLMKAKTHWVQVTSRQSEGIEAYKTTFAGEQDAFNEPQWPSPSLEELIGKTFDGHLIASADHPGLLRLLGRKPVIS